MKAKKAKHTWFEIRILKSVTLTPVCKKYMIIIILMMLLWILVFHYHLTQYHHFMVLQFGYKFL